MTRKRETGNSPEVWPADGEVLAGLVERVTFHNEENGFCVLRVKARGHRDLVTVVGYTAAIAAVERVGASGEWNIVRARGALVRVLFVRRLASESVAGLAMIRNSGLVRVLRPPYA